MITVKDKTRNLNNIDRRNKFIENSPYVSIGTAYSRYLTFLKNT